MNEHELKIFVAVYEHCGFTRAAQVLGTTQSNISKHIRNLEKSLGTRLFLRRYRVIAPTESGVKLYPQAKQMLGLMSRTERDIKLRRFPESSTE